MYIGTSLMITLYLVEYYAREIITNEYMFERWGYVSFMVPRTLYLNL
jgi:sterol O-acyltransferase